MAVEFGAACPARPEPAVVGRAVEVVLAAALGTRAPVAVEVDAHGWVLRFGGAASAAVVELPPGRHELADHWFLTVAPGAREPLPKLLAVVTAAAAAVLYGGRFVDESALLRPPVDGTDLLVEVLTGPGTTPEERLARLWPTPDPGPVDP